MKKLIQYGFAGLMLGIAGLLSSAPAHAVTCSAIDTTSHGGVWPYKSTVKACTNVSTTYAADMQGTMYAMTQNVHISNGGAALQNTITPIVYFFYTYTDYASYFGTNAQTIGTYNFGFTYTGSDKGGPYTVLLQWNRSGNEITNDTAVNNVTAHEMGHWLDYYYRTDFSGSPLLSSASTLFADELAKDWSNFNALSAACAAPANVFSGQDSVTGAAICTSGSLSTGFSGNNENVLANQAWPSYFSAANVWSEEVAFQAGKKGSGNEQITNYYNTNNSFVCTNTLVESLLRNGTIPGTMGSLYSWPAGCPTS